MTKWLPLAIIPLGLLPGLLHLSWAWVICVFWLWFMIDPSRWSPTLNKFTVILLYGYFVFCVWGLMQWFGWSMIVSYQQYLPVILILFFLTFALVLFFNPKLNSIFTKPTVFTVLPFITVLLFLMHIVLSYWSGIDFEISRWTPYIVSMLIIMVCLLLFRTSQSYDATPRTIKPLYAVMIVVVLFGQFINTIYIVRSSGDESVHYAKFVKSGRTQLAINLILHEIDHDVYQGKTNEVINDIRSKWVDLPKEQIAKQFRIGNKYKRFLFLTLFGGRLNLAQDEEIIDGIFIHEPLQYIVATTKGDLHQITNEGIFKLPFQVKNIHHIHYEPVQKKLFGITHDQRVFTQSDNIVLYYDLPTDEKWEDVVLAPTGDTFWALHSRGGIVEYSKQNDEWNLSRELYPPLWQETELAIRLLHEEINGQDVFYILDQCKGISARHPEAVTDHVLPKEDLFRFYHPDRRIAVDVKRYENKFVITDQFGQLDMVEKGVGTDFTDWKYSIRGKTSFDRNSGMWLRQDDTIALLSYPEANTLIQLKRNGVFEPIVMPQGFRLVPLKRNGWWELHDFPNHIVICWPPITFLDRINNFIEGCLFFIFNVI